MTWAAEFPGDTVRRASSYHRAADIIKQFTIAFSRALAASWWQLVAAELRRRGRLPLQSHAQKDKKGRAHAGG